jgi:hypothetical protein
MCQFERIREQLRRGVLDYARTDRNSNRFNEMRLNQSNST